METGDWDRRVARDEVIANFRVSEQCQLIKPRAQRVVTDPNMGKRQPREPAWQRRKIR